MNRFITAVLAVLCSLAPMAHAQQNWPAQSIKLIVPFAPGTASEVVLRIVAERLGAALKQSVVIENRPGGGSTLGTEAVAKSAPDGYTLAATYNSSIAPGPLMYNKLGYDPIKDFFHIAMIGVYPQYVIVRSDSPIKSIRELIDLARAKPGTINYASAGVGTSGFLAAELLKQTMNLNMVHVPYKGPGPAITDLLGGRLDMVLTASALSLAQAGKVRVLAVTGEKRMPSFPDAPALEELARGVQGVSWVGISAPAATPRAITGRLEKELLAILNAPDVQAKLAEPAVAIAQLTLGSDKFLEFIQKENRVWAPVIKAGNIKID